MRFNNRLRVILQNHGIDPNSVTPENVQTLMEQHPDIAELLLWFIDEETGMPFGDALTFPNLEGDSSVKYFERLEKAKERLKLKRGVGGERAQS